MSYFVKVRYRNATIHAVDASGGPDDGSLYGFSTLCGRSITDIDLWHEITQGASMECGSCKRVARARGVGVSQ